MAGTFTLSDAFNAAARKTVADFPELRGKFILVDVEEGTPYGLPNLALTRFPSIESLEKFLNDGAQRASAANTSTASRDEAHGLSVIFYNSAASGTEPDAALSVVHHELGHLVVPAGQAGNTILAETAADLFSAIYENASVSDIKTRAFNRAYALVTDGGADAQEHFTSFALLELAKAPTPGLTPQMAVGMADILAQQYAAKPQEVKAMAEAFQPYRDAVAAGAQPEDALKQVAKVALENKDGAGRLGAFFLSFYLDGKISIHGKPVTLAGGEWDDIRAKLKAQEAPAKPQGLLILPKSGGLGL